MASISWWGVRRPKWAGTDCSSEVLGPRPSRPRMAARSACRPIQSPPPPSPEISPMAAYRTILPVGETAQQLSPVPQTTPTPHGRSVPARSTANVSLRSTTRSAQRRACRLRLRRRSSTGRSAPARQSTAASAIGPEPGVMPALRQARATVASRRAKDPSWSWGEKLAPRPRAAPSTRPPRLSSTASSFELPPSTASTAGLAKLLHPHEVGAGPSQALDQFGQGDGGHVRPAVHERDAAVTLAGMSVEHPLDQIGEGAAGLPVVRVDRPADVSVAGPLDGRQHAQVVLAVAVRAAEPWSWVHAAGLLDHLLGLAQGGGDARVGEHVQGGVRLGVVADGVAVLGDPPRHRRVGARPAALDEEAGARAGAPERVKDRRQVARGAGEIGVLGVDGEGDACAHSRVVTLPAIANTPGVRPRQRARRQASSWAGTVAAAAARPPLSGPTEIASAPSGQSPSWLTTSTAAPAAASSPASFSSSARVPGSVAITITAR